MVRIMIRVQIRIRVRVMISITVKGRARVRVRGCVAWSTCRILLHMQFVIPIKLKLIPSDSSSPVGLAACYCNQITPPLHPTTVFAACLLTF